MAASPCWKVFNPQGEYVASCKHVEDAAMIVGSYGEGARISYQRQFTVWHEGHEHQPASDSWDYVAQVVHERFEVFASARIMAGAQSKSRTKESDRWTNLISPRFPSS